MQELAEGGEHGGLFVEITHKEEADTEAAVFDGSDADEEGAGARASGEPGGFGIEKDPARGVMRRDFVAGNAAEEFTGEGG